MSAGGRVLVIRMGGSQRPATFQIQEQKHPKNRPHLGGRGASFFHAEETSGTAESPRGSQAWRLGGEGFWSPRIEGHRRPKPMESDAASRPSLFVGFSWASPPSRPPTRYDGEKKWRENVVGCTCSVCCNGDGGWFHYPG